MKRNFSSAVFMTLLMLLFATTAVDAQDFKMRGRLQVDGLMGLNDADDFSNGFNNRRARLGANGKLTDKWDGRIEIDFADNDLDAKDFRMRRSFENNGRLWIGQFKVPYGLNELTSSNEISLIERASPSNAFTYGRRMGVAYEMHPGDFGFKTMLFGREIGQTPTGDMPIGLALRAYYALGLADGTLHLGAAGTYENNMDDTNMRFRERPEARGSDGGIRLVDSGTISDVEDNIRAGVELAFLRGPIAFEAEFFYVSLNVDNGSDRQFSGAYAQVSYALNGAKRYSKGDVRAVRPASEDGAWEFVARFSNINLNAGTITGGEQNNITLGVNRFVTRNLRFMGNLIVVNVDELDDTPILLTMRAQYHF